MAGESARTTEETPPGGGGRHEPPRTGRFVAPPVPTEAEARWGARFLVVFALPFCAVGVGAACMAAARAVAGDWRQAGFVAVFALLFGGAGFGLLAMVAAGRRLVRGLARHAREHPDEPWLWRDDWAAQQVTDAARGGMWGAIAFAVMWNLIAVPTGILCVRAALVDGNRLGLVGLLFPAAGTWLAARAVSSVARYRRFGVSVLDLPTVPIPVGHRFVGTVRATVPTPPADGFRVVLSCINRTVSGSGRDESVFESVRWQEEERVVGTDVRDWRGAGTIVPVSFRIPADAAGTDASTPRSTILWRLGVSAALPGVDYDATFEVPVYYTAESAQPPTAAEAAQPDPPPPPVRDAAPSRIVVREEADGTQLFFPADRNRGLTLSLAAFTLLWTATIWIQVRLGAPLVFPVLTGLFALLFGWIVIDLALVSSRVTVRASGVTIRRGVLGLGRTRTLATADITEVEMPIQMQAGMTPYYSILLRRRAVPGRRLAGAVTLATGLRDKREAERLVTAITRALGRLPGAAREALTGSA